MTPGAKSALLGAAFAALGGSGQADSTRLDEQGVTRVEIVAGERRWTARIEATPAGRAFVRQLPLELTLKDYAGTEKIADLPSALTTEGAPAAITPRTGDVTFYAPWGNLAIFYRDGHHSPGLIRLGRIEGDARTLKTAQSLNVTVQLATSPSQ